jgi:tRNA pseudouridine38-40 synthase
MKIKLDIEYDGTKFSGWQNQDGVITVQEVIERAISKVFGGVSVIVFGAGRTDAGVHALCQVAHIEIKNLKIINTWRHKISNLAQAINFYLHEYAVVIKSTSIATDDFHARFSAVQREYEYIICNRASKSVLLKNRVWHISRPLDVDLMIMAGKLLVGTHNFNAYRSSECQSQNPVKTIDSLDVTKEGDFILINIKAKSFLHNQVRIIAGTLRLVGAGQISTDYISNLLMGGSRTKSGPTAPPYGLYLKNVFY